MCARLSMCMHLCVGLLTMYHWIMTSSWLSETVNMQVIWAVSPRNTSTLSSMFTSTLAQAAVETESLRSISLQADCAESVTFKATLHNDVKVCSFDHPFNNFCVNIKDGIRSRGKLRRWPPHTCNDVRWEKTAFVVCSNFFVFVISQFYSLHAHISTHTHPSSWPDVVGAQNKQQKAHNGQRRKIGYDRNSGSPPMSILMCCIPVCHCSRREERLNLQTA